MRYKVIYCKTEPMFIWFDEIKDAKKKKAELEKVGYHVTIWEHNDKGAIPYTEIRQARIEAKMTQKELAEASGVNIRQIQRIEWGEGQASNLTARNLLAIAKALGVEPDSLI